VEETKLALIISISIIVVAVCCGMVWALTKYLKKKNHKEPIIVSSQIEQNVIPICESPLFRAESIRERINRLGSGLPTSATTEQFNRLLRWKQPMQQQQQPCQNIDEIEQIELDELKENGPDSEQLDYFTIV